MPPATLYRLLSVMYIGRGDYEPRDALAIYTEMSDRFTRPEAAVQQLLSKALLADYLRRGVAAIGVDGLG